MVALEEIKGHFPSGTTFEDYWPAKGSIEPVASRLVSIFLNMISPRRFLGQLWELSVIFSLFLRHGVSAGNWTQKPAGQPKTQTHTQVIFFGIFVFFTTIRGLFLVDWLVFFGF